MLECHLISPTLCIYLLPPFWCGLSFMLKSSKFKMTSCHLGSWFSQLLIWPHNIWVQRIIHAHYRPISYQLTTANKIIYACPSVCLSIFFLLNLNHGHSVVMKSVSLWHSTIIIIIIIIIIINIDKLLGQGTQVGVLPKQSNIHQTSPYPKLLINIIF